jgi:uncharacterized protein (DUF1015 family)
LPQLGLARAVARQSGNLRKGNADVADFLPFRGIRYDPELLSGARPATLDAVAAPPYDVIDDEERAALEARDPHNSVRLILPRDEGAIDRYQVAAATLTAWSRLGILRTDLAPQLYGYEMRFHDDAGHPRRTRGVLGALALPPAGDAGGANAILPHERTLPKAKSDRLELLRATRANTDPIWGLSLTDGLTELLDPLGNAAAVCTDDEGVAHELFPIQEPDRIEAIRAAVARSSVVLADGHHRFETACTYRDERLAAGLDDDGAAAIMTLVVELVEHELSVRAIHRLLDGIASVDLRIALRDAFDVIDAGANEPDGVAALTRHMVDDGALGLVDRAGLALLVPRAEVFAERLVDVPAEERDVDAARFEAGVMPVIPGARVTYRNDAAAVAAIVDKGGADAAVLLRPVTVEQIRRAALAGVRMPQKTTFFHPKLRTGMVFRSLDD